MRALIRDTAGWALFAAPILAACWALKAFGLF